MIETDEKERIGRLVRIVDKMLRRLKFRLKIPSSYKGPVYIVPVSDETEETEGCSDSLFLRWNSLSDCFLGNNQEGRQYVFLTVFDFLSHMKTIKMKKTGKDPWFFYKPETERKTFSSFSELELWLAVRSE